MKKIPELLAPAGGLEELKAAVENGADAVYIGGRLFNARINAENFDQDELKMGIEYAHIRGVNVYVAMNTLVADDEMQAALAYAVEVYKAGADALIIQDLGFAGLVRKHLPDFPMHLSTQGTIYNIEGVRAAEKLGFSRMILARELSLETIRSICAQTSAEIEVFVHGALCMSFSGQCLLSQVIGGRSGNRGQCAQPCRLPYSLLSHEGRGETQLVQSSYMLSPKDLWSIEHLDQLAEAGVSSIKIEGRMKSAEYVAIVTGIYRKYLDSYMENGNTYQVDETDIKALKQSFNRGGFTTGYLFGNQGKNLLSGKLPKHQGVYIGTVKSSFPARRLAEINLEDRLSIGDGVEIWSDSLPGNVVTFMKRNNEKVDFAEKGETVMIGDIDGDMSPGDAVYKITDKQLNKLAQLSYQYKPEPRVAIHCAFTAKRGQSIELILSDDEGHESKSDGGYMPQEAVNRAVTQEMIMAQLAKTGGTPFKIKTFNLQIEEGLSIPMSEINLLRRTALEELTAMRQHKYPHREQISTKEIHASTKAPVVKTSPSKADTSPAKAETPHRSAEASNIVKRALYFYPLNGSKSYQLVNKNFEEHIFTASKIYLPYSCFLTKDYSEIFREYADRGVPLIAVIPSITMGYHDFVLGENLERIIRNPFVSGISLGNLGWASECLKLGADIYGDFGLNLLNSSSFETIKAMGFKGGVVAHEASLDQISQIDFSGLCIEAATYGRLPVMVTEHCLIGNQKACSGGHHEFGETSGCGLCNSGSFYLRDRKGAEFPVITDNNSCRTTILSHQIRPLKHTSADLAKIGIVNQRLYILDETVGDIEGV